MLCWFVAFAFCFVRLLVPCSAAPISCGFVCVLVCCVVLLLCFVLMCCVLFVCLFVLELLLLCCVGLTVNSLWGGLVLFWFALL